MAAVRVREGDFYVTAGVTPLFEFGPDITVTDRVAAWENNRMRRDLWYFPLPAANPSSMVSTAERQAELVPAFNQRGGRSRLNWKPRVRDFSGSFRAMNFTDILYGGLKMEPTMVDVGTVLTAQTREVELWNATFSPVTIQQILGSNANGVTLAFPDDTPFVMAPLESIMFTVAAEPAGPAEIDASFLINAASPVKDVTLRVIGRRSVIFTIIPSTAKPYVEKLSWLTDIITSYDGSEQRISITDYPDVEISFSVENHSRVIHMMDALLWGWQHRIYSLPLWHRATKLTQPAFSSNSVVYMDTSNCGFQLEGIALLWRSDTDYEAQEILEIHADRLVFKRDLQASWGKGSLCMATRSARLPADVASNWMHPDLATFSLRFILENPEIESAQNQGTLYRSYYIFLTPHNWTSPVQEQNTRLLDVFETDTGAKYTLQRQATPVITRNHTLFLNSKAKIAAFRRWLYARRGSATPFWLSTGKSDFKVMARIEAGDDEITVQDVGYHALYQQRMQREDIRIETRLGVFHRRIVASAAGLSKGTEILRVDTPFLERIEPNQVIMVAFLGLNRLESDTIEMEWKSDKLVTCNFNTRMLSDNVTGG